MQPQQNRIHVYILLVAVICAAVVAYYITRKDSGEPGVYSHTEFIQRFEQRRAENQQRQLTEEVSPASAGK